MKVMLVNKFHWPKGGSETYYFELGKLLKKHGHQVAYFSMENKNNVKTEDKEYFVKPFDSNSKNIFKAKDAIYSKNNKAKMIEALEDFKPDIVHVNLFQRHLTYSIIEACKEKSIPVIQTAHDLQAICPASAMLSHGKICDKCLNGSKYNCFKNKCIKESRIKSLLSSIEGTKYKTEKVYDMFDAIITPSSFVGNMLKKEKINTKIITLHNFVDTDKFNDNNNEDNEYVFYFGRLSVEKGIINLLKAFSKQKYGNLYIAGDGPEKNNILDYIHNNNLGDRIKLLGFLKQNEVIKYISNSSFVVVPSIWYENCPYSILESLAIGKPIIGSNIGGIPELIKHDKNGYLFDYNDVDELSRLISDLFQDKLKRERFGNYSRKLAKEQFDTTIYYNDLIKIYNDLVGGRKSVNKTNE